jgi:hypothetical protein
VLFELPITTATAIYRCTLSYSGSSIALTYNGTVLSDGAITYNAESALTVGALSIPLIGLGSFGGGGEGGGGDNGGGDGDPYVTTMAGLCYKLPTMDAPIRYFQTMTDGKLLTINAQLKTVESTELMENTLRSLLQLKDTMNKYQFVALAKQALKPETLCFFERIRIQYGEEVLCVNLWDSKFDVLENTLNTKPERVDRTDLIEKTKIYSGYNSNTLKFTFGTTSVFLSVYNSPMVRNGIYLETDSAKINSNGVIVNTLSKKDMTLASLSSLNAVSKTSSTKKTVTVETFADHDGVRSRNIVSYH